MAKFKITHELENCIGCGACTHVDEDHWEMKGDKAHLKGSEKDPSGNTVLTLDEAGKMQEAADTCPVQCIKVEKLED